MNSHNQAHTAHWYFDVISPFAYLQWHQLRRLKAQGQLPIDLKLRPILFAGLLKAHGQLGPAEIPSKRRYTYRHVLWLAQQQGTCLRFPPAHPFNPLPLLRLIIAAGNSESAVDRVFDFVWGQGHLPSDGAAMQQLAEGLGVAEWQAAIQAPEVKQQLLDNTEAALAQDVFGVPTLVHAGELFWGQDSTEFFLAYLAGGDQEESLLRSAPYRAVDALPSEVQRPR